MGFDQYHEPPEELPAETRTFARLCASLEEECQAIGWYQQRLAVEPDADARAIMTDAQGEEFKHFSMDLEFLLRQKKDWRAELKEILFTTGDIVAGNDGIEARRRQSDFTQVTIHFHAVGAGGNREFQLASAASLASPSMVR